MPTYSVTNCKYYALAKFISLKEVSLLHFENKRFYFLFAHSKLNIILILDVIEELQIINCNLLTVC